MADIIKSNAAVNSGMNWQEMREMNANFSLQFEGETNVYVRI